MVTPGIVFFLCSENLPNFIFRKLCWKKNHHPISYLFTLFVALTIGVSSMSKRIVVNFRGMNN
jgi:hypothetical protein